MISLVLYNVFETKSWGLGKYVVTIVQSVLWSWGEWVRPFGDAKYYCKNNDINITKVDYGENIVLKIEMEKNRKNIFLKDIETKTLKIKEYQVIQDKFINKVVEKNK